jgi:cell division protein FtsL
VLLASVLALGVYKSKSDARAARARLATLEEKVAEQREIARSLRAEAQYLQNPKRIEELARTELGMAPAAHAQQRELSSLDKPAP